MSQLVFLLSCLLCVAHCQIKNHSLPIRLPNTPLNTSCPLHRDHVIRRLVRETLDEYHQDSYPDEYHQDSYPDVYHPQQHYNISCSCGGDGGWTRAVHLNMSDINQQCPDNWTLITTPIRGCGRTNINRNVCDSVTYPVHNLTYSNVCGKIVAYQRGWKSAFYNNIPSIRNSLEEAYISGVSLTHGLPGSRRHIWSFVGGEYELDDDRYHDLKCPCSTTNWSYEVPPFISNDYFCDSGNPGPIVSSPTYYIENPLWDGQGCGSNSTCCQFNTPPWFCTALPQPTNEDLEIRNCNSYSSSYEDTLLSSIDIYIK